MITSLHFNDRYLKVVEDFKSGVKILRQALVLTGMIYSLYLAIYVTSPVDPHVFKSKYAAPEFIGVLQPNDRLQQVERLFEKKLRGPESTVKDAKGNYYAGLADGRIARLCRNGTIEEIARTGKKNDSKYCDASFDSEPECGRPLGMRFDDSGEDLIVCDPYHGLLRVNIAKKTKETLVTLEEGIDGLPFQFMNDVVIGENDMVYFTDTSWKWDRRNSRYEILEATGRGRLVSFNLRTKEKKLLMSGLFLPNGLEISSDKDFLLLTESTKSNVLRYNLKGPYAGEHTIFAENLPGYPANIRSSPTGGYWVGLIAVRKQPFSFLDFAGPYPFLRAFIAKMVSIDTMTKLIPKYGMILRLDENGSINESLHDPSGKIIDEIIDVFEDKEENALLLGSYKHEFLGRLPLTSE